MNQPSIRKIIATPIDSRQPSDVPTSRFSCEMASNRVASSTNTTVVYAFRPLQLFLIVLGLSPCVERRGGHRHRRVLCWVQFLVCTVNYCYLCVWNNDFDFWNLFNSQISVKSGIVFQTVSLIYPLILLVLNFALSDSFETITEELHVIDEKLNDTTGSCYDHRRHRRAVIILMIGIAMVAGTMILICHPFMYGKRFLKLKLIVSQLVGQAHMAAICIYFVVIVWFVCARYQRVVETLR